MKPRPRQRRFDFRRKTRAGKLAKAPGRKRVHRSDPRHRTRPPHNPRHPVHVVLRVTPAIRNLRGFAQYRAFRGAIGQCAARADYRIVHVSIQSSHVHLVCEAEHRRALAHGMQGFAISAAKRLNKALGRKRGSVFAYRYHATALASPTQARNAIAYVLNNWRQHGADRDSARRGDPYSNAWAFYGEPMPKEPLPVVSPTTWLLTDGWKRAGPIRPYSSSPSSPSSGSVDDP